MDQSLFPTEGFTFSLRQRPINGNKIPLNLWHYHESSTQKWFDSGLFSPVFSGQVRVFLAKQGVVPSPEARPFVDHVEDAGVPMKGHQ